MFTCHDRQCFCDEQLLVDTDEKINYRGRAGLQRLVMSDVWIMYGIENGWMDGYIIMGKHGFLSVRFCPNSAFGGTGWHKCQHLQKKKGVPPLFYLDTVPGH